MRLQPLSRINRLAVLIFGLVFLGVGLCLFIDREFAWFPLVINVPFSLTFIAIGAGCLVAARRAPAAPANV
jgi:hypothetical protein